MLKELFGIPAACVTAFMEGAITLVHGRETHEQYRRRMAKEYGREVSDDPPPTPRNKP